ncbi:MAG TPA: hypothetical protein VHF25_16870 [Nitriliruptorales bacterium]|nr:hypothetical protein [Nitriliruptorales bacterium]
MAPGDRVVGSARWARHTAIAVALVASQVTGSLPVAAQEVPVTVEVRRDVGSPAPPTPPTPSPPDGPARPVDPGQPDAGPGPAPASPAPPLPRTGVDAARALRDAVALVAAGIALLVAARTPERKTTR